jgi:hypothetical protein
MDHPLSQVINQAQGLLLIGDSAAGRFPAYSYNAYTHVGKRFYCLDMGGLERSRGPTSGGKVYARIEDLPPDRGDLAIIWVKPERAAEAVEWAQRAGARRVWFSFETASAEAVARAGELGLEVVEIGRCPVYYLDGAPLACAAHTLMVRITGKLRPPPRTTFAG